jgi:hypothetical protein
MGISIKKSKLVFILLSTLGLLLSVLGYFILPDKFFFDTDIIIKDRFNEIGLIGSYPFTIWFYKITGLKQLHFSIIAAIQFSLIIYTTYRIGVPKNFHKLTLKNSLIYSTFFVLSIFLSMPTKEFINFIYVALIVFIFKSRKFKHSKTIIIGLLLLLFFGFFFRGYYVLIFVSTLTMALLSFIKFKNKRTLTIVSGLGIVIIMSLSYGFVKGVFISENTREALNVSRQGVENANSMIVSPLKTDVWYGEAFGIVYGFFSVNLPVNGLKYFLSPQIIIFIFWQLFLFIILFIKYGNCLKENKKDNYEIWLFYMLFSYFIVQGVFEPDLGSAVRHKAGVFPFIYYLLYYEEFRKKLR